MKLSEFLKQKGIYNKFLNNFDKYIEKDQVSIFYSIPSDAQKALAIGTLLIIYGTV